ncbi:MAG: SUMF1/EgtB/PvdO family nonheme iron enzyme [Verrucomicrobiales bacterium]
MTCSGVVLCWLLGAVAAPAASGQEAAAVDFNAQVKPILESACVHCHGETKQQGDYRLDTREEAFKRVDDEAMLVAGKPDESRAYTTTILAADDDDVMPPSKDGPPLDKTQTEILRAWIAGGAAWPEGVQLEKKPRMDFVKHIRPIFETACLSCHNPEKMKGDYDMTTKAGAFKVDGDHGDAIVPFQAENSSVFVLMSHPSDHDDLMPPANSGGPLAKEKVEQVRLWIAQGAIWPEGLEPLVAKEAALDRPPNPDNPELVKKIHAFILETSKEQSESEMNAYETVVPKTGATYGMVPIKGGAFLMGSPESEAGRRPDEGPQVKVTVDPFWMGRHEVTWNEYLPFQTTPIDRHKDGSKKSPNPTDPPVDVVSSPTGPYTEMSFGMGQDGYPAIAMTEHAALKYCQWLSAQTGHFYRLPTEAEWEYACRAGTTSAYHFGDDPNQLADYGWYLDNSMEGYGDNQYQKVGLKKPNPWGLFDMHGNVMEWVLDQHLPDGHVAFAPEANNPWAKPTTLWGRVAKGGSWLDVAADLRSAARRKSLEAWKKTDPQFPKSIWYLTDVKWIGFRLIRPLRVPSPEEMHFIWNNGRPEELAARTAAAK